MTVLEPPSVGLPTLADRLSEGRMPLPEALRYATLLGEALRTLHDRGYVHGAVSPKSVLLVDGGIDLTPAAPELEGHTAHIATDIFAFGAVLYAMLTGDPESNGTAALAPQPTGSATADRLIARCLGKEPPRLPNMQKVLLELKLVAVAARHAEVPTAMRREAANELLRTEMQQLEARLDARLEEREKSAAESRQASGDVVNTLRTEFAAAREQLAVVQQGVEAVTGRLAALEHNVDAVSQCNATLAVKLVEDIHKLEKSIETQAVSIESIRMSTAQTDDLLERVVGAMETIQDSILDAANAHS